MNFSQKIILKYSILENNQLSVIVDLTNLQVNFPYTFIIHQKQ